MRIGVIGTGYVGITSAACLAELGHRVACFDKDTAKLEQLARGGIPIHEPGLGEMVEALVADGSLRFAADLRDCLTNCEIVFIAVGTPARPDGDIDLSQVTEACETIAPLLAPNAIVAIKSTVSAGTCRKMRELIGRKARGLAFSVVSNPEFLREGSAIRDFMRPDRIVIGADDRRAAALMERLYEPLRRHGAPVLHTSTVNAEMIKHAANALLALKIGFINSVADLCEAVGGNVQDVAAGIGLDARIGPGFLQAGPGFGGSCFPKDTKAFAATGRKNGAAQPLVETLIRVNQDRRLRLADRIVDEGAVPPGGTVAVLGLAFKAGTDDLRDSPALAIIERLRARRIKVRAHDPVALDGARRMLAGIELLDCPYAAATGADAVAIVTEWPHYAELDARRLAAAMRGNTLFDFRNILPSGFDRMGQLELVRLGTARPPAARTGKVVGAGSHKIGEDRAASPMR